ncbi:MAG TPA: hypothetical protein VGA45_03475, partial [Actinomycetota bacterium]
MPGSAREEAERLVATFLAMASTASSGDKASGTGEAVAAGLGALGDIVGRVAGAALGQAGSQGGSPGGGHAGSHGGQVGGHGGGHGAWATGSAECCVCPLCKVIAAMRDPSPETAAKLAVGAGDLANGVASMMRALSAITGERPATKQPSAPRPQATNPDET